MFKLRSLVALALLLTLFAIPSFAQSTTTVTGTIVDNIGIPYANATVRARLAPIISGTQPAPTSSGVTVNGFPGAVTTSSTGAFTIVLVDNSTMVPAPLSGSWQWRFEISLSPGVGGPVGTGPQTFNSTITISGSSQSISTTLNAAAPALTNISASGAGTVTTSGSPVTGAIAKFSGATAITSGDLSGDVTTTGTLVTTLASVVTAGTCGDTTHSCGLTYNAKGLITAATNNAISGGGGGAALSSISAATGANTIASGNNSGQIWNWALTSNGVVAMTFGETTAATGTGTNYILEAKTLAGSTAIPLNVTNSLTGSQTLSSLVVTPTWNTTGVVDAGIFENVINTASGTGSLLMDLQIGGTSQFKVDKVGNVTILGTLTSGGCSGCAGAILFPQGTANSNVANNITIQAPTAVTAYTVTLAGAAATGLIHYTNSSNVITETISAVTPSDATGNTSGSGNFVLVTSPTLVAPSLGAATATSLAATGNVDGTIPVTVETGTSFTMNAFLTGYWDNQEATAAQAVTANLPTSAVGLYKCVDNSWNGSAATTGVLTVATSASGQFIIFTDGTLSATGGNVTSGGAAGDSACFRGVDSTHWQMYVQSGTWTKH